MYRRAVLFALAGSPLLLTGACVTPSDASPGPKPASTCFLSRDWESWRPSADSKSIYIRVGIHDYYRLDLSAPCPQLQDPTAHLVTHSTSAWVCHPLDLDLRVSDSNGFRTACIVRSITPMTKAEIDALPPKQRP